MASARDFGLMRAASLLLSLGKSNALCTPRQDNAGERGGSGGELKRVSWRWRREPQREKCEAGEVALGAAVPASSVGVQFAYKIEEF